MVKRLLVIALAAMLLPLGAGFACTLEEALASGELASRVQVLQANGWILVRAQWDPISYVVPPTIPYPDAEISVVMAQLPKAAGPEGPGKPNGRTVEVHAQHWILSTRSCEVTRVHIHEMAGGPPHLRDADELVGGKPPDR